jgi:hypothetical protein
MSLPKLPWKARRFIAASLGLAAAATLAGCSSHGGGPQLVCPIAEITPGLGMIPQFGPGAGHKPSDVQVSGIITSIKPDCSRAENGITIKAAVAIMARRAYQEVKTTQLPYFIAVADSRQHILAKQAFTLNVEFIANESYHSYTENITVHLPLSSVAAGGDYIVLAGFQLTKDQLDFMRTNKPQ